MWKMMPLILETSFRVGFMLSSPNQDAKIVLDYLCELTSVRVPANLKEWSCVHTSLKPNRHRRKLKYQLVGSWWGLKSIPILRVLLSNLGLTITPLHYCTQGTLPTFMLGVVQGSWNLCGWEWLPLMVVVFHLLDRLASRSMLITLCTC